MNGKKTKSETKVETKRTTSSSTSQLQDEQADANKRNKSEAKVEESSELKKSKSENDEAKTSKSGKQLSKSSSSSTAAAAATPSTAGASDEEQRTKCRSMLEEAMSTPPLPSAEGAKGLQEVSQCIEEALFAACEGLSKEYRTRFRTLFLNLKNPKNTELRLQLYYGELPFERLVRMTSDELAPRELQEEKARIAKWHAAAITRSVDAGAATDLFRCAKCQQRKCTYFQMQTRSADEPMTSFITCLNCGNRWKIN